MTQLPRVDLSQTLQQNFSLDVDPAVAFKLLQTISVKVSQAWDFESALLQLLELVCARTDWTFGEVWLPSDAQLLNHSGIWYSSQPHLQEFGLASKAFRFAPKRGLPGRVFASGQTEWITDVSTSSIDTFHRKPLAIKHGLGAGIGVPVPLDDKILMVLVFFMGEARERDRSQIHLIETIAAQLGAILRLKRTEAQLFAHQKHLQRMLNTLPGIVFTAKGPPDWKMRSMSNGCLSLTGYAETELIDADGPISYNDITHADDLPRVLDTIQAALKSSNTYEVEYRLITKGGDEKWVWEKGQGIFDKDNSPIGIQGFITDITTLKRIEAALRKSETRYRMLAERSLDLISQHDLTGVFQYVSPACQNLLGYEPRELIGQSVETLLHPDDQKKIARLYRQFLRRRVVQTLRFRMQHRDGHYCWFETISCVVNQETDRSRRQILAVTRDITNRVQAEQTLIDREKFLNLVLDNVPQHLYWKDRDGVYLGCNQAFANSLGFETSSTIIGRTDADIPAYSAKDVARNRQQDKEIIETGQAILNSLESRQGFPLQRWVNVSKFPIHDSEQTVIGVLGSLEDVSDRIAFQESLDKRERYLTALVEIQRQLLHLDSTWDSERFQVVLQPLAAVTGADRVYLYEVDTDSPNLLVQRAQWANCESLSTFQHPSVAVFDLAGPVAPWIEELQKGNCINQTLEEFPAPLKKQLGGAPSYITSILLLPLHVRGRFSGVIGFSSCHSGRNWSQTEVTLLRIAANALAIATERFQAEVFLQQAENKYRSIVENAVEGIFQTTTSGRYTMVNPMLAKIYGYDSPQELIETLVDIEHQLYVDPHRRQMFIEQILEEGAVIGYESAVYKKDGSVIWISESARITHDHQGKVIGFEGTVKDITERKQADFELQRRDRLLQGVAQASQYLLTDLDIDHSIPQVLSVLGCAANADRVYLYENHSHPLTGELCMSMRYEWTQNGIAPSIHQEHWQNQPYSNYGLMRWYRAFMAGQAIRGKAITFPKNEQRLLALDQIKAILMVPIFIDQYLWGYIGFDSCTEARNWTQGEESILVTIAASIGGALKRRHTEAQMRYQAYHDPLTGLPNRTAFNQHLPHAIAKAKQTGTCVAVMFLDLDRFKNINDTLGHAIGDQLLKEATQRLQKELRKEDMLARWGGDEFTLILNNISCIDETAAIAERLLQSLKPPFLLENHELYITGSIGIALFPHDGDNVTTLLQNADAAMYAAKTEGRNTRRFYVSTLSSTASRHLLLEKYLHQALQKEEFKLFFQPQIDLAQKRICRIEALVRWQSPELGSVLPNEFIPIAEEIGLIIPLGEWVLEQACSQLRSWHQQGFEHLQVAVNLSARQLQQASLVQTIQTVLTTHRLVPQHLELEVTETAALSNLEASTAILKDLRNLGTRLVMDDFGTGYSSLNYLKMLPFHGLKIDRSFVQGIPGDAQDVAMLKAVIALGKALELDLVAEGVETQEQMSCLAKLGCNFMQGYWFTHPLSKDGMTAFLQAHWPRYTGTE